MFNLPELFSTNIINEKMQAMEAERVSFAIAALAQVAKLIPNFATIVLTPETVTVEYKDVPDQEG